MVGERSIENISRSVALNRRGVLGGIVTVISVGVAGCMGDESREEIGASLEAPTSYLEDAGTGFDELQTNLDNEDWESCLTSVDPIRDDLSAAEQDATDAQSLAEEEGQIDRATQDIQWPPNEEDQADLGFNQTVYFGLDDMSTAPSELRDQYEGMTVATNAQMFESPSIENDSLRV